MTIDFEITINSGCPAAVDNIELFSLTTNSADGSLVRVMRVFYKRSSGFYRIDGDYGGPSQTMKTIYSTLSDGDQFHLLMKMSFTPGIANARGTVGAKGVYVGAYGYLEIPNAIKFDSTTKFFFCTDVNGDPHAYCEIVGFSMWYDFDPNSNGFPAFAGFYPIPVALYEFNQGSGHVIRDSYNNLADAYLGASTANNLDVSTSPVWNLADQQRLQFTNPSQYITLPTFEISRFHVFKYSFSVSCWIKASASSSGYILKYAGSDGTVKFGIQLKSDRRIWGKIGVKTNSLNTLTVPTDTWTLITVFILHTEPAYTSYISVYIGMQKHGAVEEAIATLISTSPDDKVTIGPFSNPPVSIYGMKIFSPGAYSPQISSTCSTPTSFCDISLGPANVQNCLTCKSGSYMKNFGCLRECYTYSDGSCKMDCSYPYIPRNETLGVFCDFKCDSNQYLYSDGSCLSTCTSPAVKYQNLTNEWYCKGPCEGSSKFYYPDKKACLTSCSENYDEDYSLFYKRCLLAKVSETIKSTIEVTDKAGTASRAITQATTALSSGSPLGISASVAGKIFSNIKFLNISYSVGLQEALLNWKSNFINLEFMPDMPMSIQDNIVSQPVPYMFEKYDLESSFLMNFWNNLLLLVFLAMAFFIIRATEFLVKSRYSEKILNQVIILRAMLQNFLLTQLYSVYGDVLFYSTLEYRSIDLREGLTSLSFSSGIILTLVMLASLFLHFFFLRKYQRIKKTQSDPEILKRFIKSHEGNFVLFRDFKDHLLIQQSFLLLLTARDLACSLLITTLFRHPLAQGIIILLLNLLMIAYLILRNPFVSLFDYIQQFFYEFITLTVSVNVLILAIMDGIASEGKELRTNIGNFIIITNLCFNFGALGFMLVKGWFIVKEIYDSYKAKRQLSKNPKIKRQRPESRGLNPYPKKTSFEISEKATNNGSLIKDLNTSQTPLDAIETQKKEDFSNVSELEMLEVEDLEESSPDLQTKTMK